MRLLAGREPTQPRCPFWRLVAFAMNLLHRRFARLCAVLAACLVCSLAVAAAPAAQAGTVYTVAVVPQFAPVRVYEDWRPFLDALQKATGLRFHLVTYSSIPKFEAAYVKGKPDFAFMNPYDVVVAHRARGYRPLVRDTRPLSGILVVRADSDIHELAQLAGKQVGFPAPNAFGASLYMRALLQRQGVRIDPVYLGTHQNVYRAVARGDVVAGGAVHATLMREPVALRQLLRVIYVTPSTAPHALAVNPRVPDAVARRVQQAILGMPARAADAALLLHVQMPHPVQANYRRDYAPLERLHLERFYVRPQVGDAR